MLVQQPIASLRRRRVEIFDVAMAHLDTQGREVAALQFLPAASATT